MTAMPLRNADELGRAQEQVLRLRGHLHRCRSRRHDLLRALRNERRLRLEAEANARRFHALMLEARIGRLP